MSTAQASGTVTDLRASSTQSLLNSTALLRLCCAGVLGLALTSALLATPAFADGGVGGEVGGQVGPGGTDSPTGSGQDPGSTAPGGGGGGGAGSTGGPGGASGAGGGAGGTPSPAPVAAADGDDALASSGSAGGGGGGAHGAVSATVPGVGVYVGGNGGNGGAGFAGGSDSAGGGGGAGGYGFVLNGSVANGDLTANDPTGGNGGKGGDTTATNSGGGWGGSGGKGFYATGNSTLEFNSNAAGGRGGDGGNGVISGGGGGAGGDAIYMNSGGGLTLHMQVTGGAGGNGGNGGNFGFGGAGGAGVVMNTDGTVVFDGLTLKGGNGGNGGATSGGGTAGSGGAGGIGIKMNAGGGVTVQAGSTIAGGNGGSGGNAAAGGVGGAGISMTNSGTVTVNGTVNGGNGGAGGAPSASNGKGGAAISMNGGGTVTLESSGRVTGGDVGIGPSATPESGGDGITGANLTVINKGIIAGGGSLIGAPRANAVTFTGGTTNVFEMWSGSSTSGNVVDTTGTGKLRLGGATSDSFDASDLSVTVGGIEKYQGFAHIEKAGTSTWTLTNTSSYAGDINITQGSLRVDGTLNSVTQTTVANNTTLFGTGSLGGLVQVNAGGRFAPGDGGTPGLSMTVGSLSLAPNATYAVNLNPTTSSFANVIGNASLGGATVQANFATVGGYVQKQYTILNAGSITGTFDPSVTTFGLPSGFNTSLAYDPSNTKVFLDLALNILPPSGPTPPSQNGVNTNQRNVANAVFNFYTTTTGDFPIAFGNLTTPQSLTQVSGELGTGSQQTTFQAMNLFMGLITDPFSAGRGVAHNGPTAFADDSESMAYAGRAKSKSPRDAFAAFTKAPPAVFAQRWNVWAAGYGGSQTTDGNAVVGSNNTTSSVYGGAAGADYWFSPDTVAGFALAGGGSNFSVANGGSGRSDMFQAGAFVRQNFDATYVTASVAYGWQDVTTDRYLSVAGVDHLRANFNANAYSGRLELGHRFLTPWFGGLGVSPYAAAQITAFELPSYAERAISGASTFALNYGADTATSSRTELGLRTDKSYALDGAVLTLRGRAAWAHDFNPDRSIAATFQTLPGASFVVNGAALASDSALTTASAEVRWMNGWSVAATFEGEFSDVTRSYAGKGVVRYNW